jgi:predicted ATPase/DNA-binding SARP family transcriptional activator
MPSTAARTSRPPVPLTPLVGRVRETEELLSLLDETRLLTLTGAGGSGKTRLALEVLQRASGDDPAGERTPLPVIWVELAGVADPELLPQQVVRALGVLEEIRSADPRVVLPFLGDDPLLLALDNCEHLVEACAQLAETLLAARPHLRILATSREALGIPGERAWLVPPLGLPDPGASTEAMAEAEAVRLFEARARDVARDFRLTATNTPVVAEICRRLDGIPLAIELAAARVKVLAVEQLRDRLNDRFSLLTSGARTMVPRHRTLRATVDWSHDLLSEPARVLFRRLSVFRGGFTLDGAVAVGGEEGTDSLEVLDRVALLVERSLLTVREVKGAARYGMLETIREYGLLRLDEAGETAEVRTRHAAFFASEAATAAPHLTGPRRQAFGARLLVEVENVRDALAWTRATDPVLHLSFVADLWWFWFFTRFWKDPATWILGALALPEAAAPGHARARLLFGVGALRTLQAQVDKGRVFLEEAAQLAEKVGDEHLGACVQNYLALSYGQVGDLRMREHTERARAWFREHDDDNQLRFALLMSALEAHFSGDPERSDRYSAEAVEVARRLSPADMAIALQNWSLIWSLRGDLDRAEALTRASLAALRAEHSYLFLARGIAFLGEVAGVRGDPVAGARLLGVAHALRESIEIKPFGADAARLARVEPALREAAGTEAFEAAFEEGTRVGWESVVDALLEGWGPDDLRAAVADAWPDATSLDTAALIPLAEGWLSEVGEASPAPSAPEAFRVPSRPGAPAPSPAGHAEASQPRGQAKPSRARSDPEPAPALRIRTLGSFEVEGDAVEEGTWTYARPRELLLFLLLNPRGVTRAEIGEAIWPDATPPQVKNSFHVTLHHVRKRLGGPGWIRLEGERYLLDRTRNVVWDAEEFEREIKAALDERPAPDPERLSRVLALYGGPILDGGGGARWLEDARDRFRRSFVEGLTARARALEDRGDRSGAIEAWSRVVEEDALNEEGHRGLMRGWTASGSRDRALRHFDRLRILLHETIEAEPEAETVRLRREIAAGGEG